jgi:carboxyl-terminal processing protease
LSTEKWTINTRTRLETLIQKGEKILKIETLKKLIVGCLLLTTACISQATDPKSEVVSAKSAEVASQASQASKKPDMPALLAQVDTPVAAPVAKKAPSDKGDSVDKQEEEKDPKRDYSKLLKDPKELGFEPDEALFRNVYYYIHKSFVEDVSSDQLFQGVKSEVKDLLEQAKVPTADMDKIDPNKKVLPQILALYGDKVDQSLLTFSAILGMLDGVEDPYSLLMLPDDYAKLQEQMQSTEFGGIGIYIELDKDNGDRLTVVEPLEGTPAYKAGLLSGDKIMKIDGASTDGIDIEQAQTKLRGLHGSEVKLEISRKGEPGPLTFSVVRGKIQVLSVSSKIIDDTVGYVRLRVFGAETGEELAKAVSSLKKQGATSLIIDLRNNGGGYIDAAVDVVGQFLDKSNGLVVYTIDRENRRREYRSEEISTPALPTLVLVNEFSASASEITAGALRDHGLAKLIGVKSFGKGSVQQLYPFADGSALKLTIAKFYTPSGYVINQQGLEPDIKVEMEPREVGRGEKDIQLKKAVELSKKASAQKVPARVGS